MNFSNWSILFMWKQKPLASVLQCKARRFYVGSPSMRLSQTLFYFYFPLHSAGCYPFLSLTQISHKVPGYAVVHMAHGLLYEHLLSASSPVPLFTCWHGLSNWAAESIWMNGGFDGNGYMVKVSSPLFAYISTGMLAWILYVDDFIQGWFSHLNTIINSWNLLSYL